MTDNAAAVAPTASIGRVIVAVLSGMVVCVALITMLQGVSVKIYPPPAGLDPNDMESIKAHIRQIPVGALLLVLVSWAAGTLGGSAVAARIGSSRGAPAAYVVGGVAMFGAIYTMIKIPHPAWFMVAGPVAIILATCLGSRLGRK